MKRFRALAAPVFCLAVMAPVFGQIADSAAVQAAAPAAVPDTVTGASQAQERTKPAMHSLTIENNTDVFTSVRIRVLPRDTTVASLEIPAGEKAAVRLPDGKYVELIRFGSDSTEYRYGKGEGFELSAPGAGQWIEATLTLDGLEEGNYRQDDVTAEEFEGK
ncbi:MAG: hypothetical protein QUS35_06345 [bacterium]|nr:hypothetical protein [bacterium]